MFNDKPNFSSQHFALKISEASEVKFVDQFGMNPLLQIFEFRLFLFRNESIQSCHEHHRIERTGNQAEAGRQRNNISNIARKTSSDRDNLG